MANMLDYLEWRGDILFKEAELNDIDNIIFAWLSYVDFSDAMKDNRSITIGEAAKIILKKNNLEDILAGNDFYRTAYLILDRLSRYKRYMDIKISRYVSLTDNIKEIQFGAITFTAENRFHYVAFRGTDNSLIGWKEDLMLGVMEEVPAQKEAVKYLEDNFKLGLKKIYIGGHSKGGNLAVYAAVHATRFIKMRIEKVYNNDGPGFNNNFCKNDNYRQILNKINTFVPQSSIVGMLLEHEEKHKVVKSLNKGINQHNPMNWEVKGTEFDFARDTDDFSKAVDLAVKNWYSKLDKKERGKFIQIIFDMLASTGATKLSDLSEDRIKKAVAAIKTLNNIDAEEKKMVTKATILLLSSGKEAISFQNTIKKITHIKDKKNLI